MKPHQRHAWVLGLNVNVFEKGILHVIAHRVDQETMTCYVSMPRLALEAGMSERKARTVVRDLVAAGLVRVTLGGGSTASTYALISDDTPASRAPVTPAPHAPLGGTPCPGTPAAQVGDPGRSRRIPRHAVPPNQLEPVLNQLPSSTPPTIWDVWEGIAPGKRSVLGKLIKLHGEDAVASAVGAVSAKRPADPVGYLNSILRKRGSAVSTDGVIGSAI